MINNDISIVNKFRAVVTYCCRSLQWGKPPLSSYCIVWAWNVEGIEDESLCYLTFGRRTNANERIPGLG